MKNLGPGKWAVSEGGTAMDVWRMRRLKVQGPAPKGYHSANEENASPLMIGTTFSVNTGSVYDEIPKDEFGRWISAIAQNWQSHHDTL